MFLSKRFDKKTDAGTMPPSSASASFLQSPNAIPPRTSSTLSGGAGAPTQSAAAVTQPQQPPPKSVLRPVAEGDWLGQVQKSGQQRRKPSNPTNTLAAAVAPAPSSSFPITMPQPQPPPDPLRYAHEDLNFTTSKKLWTEEKERAVCGPFDYLYGQPGKEFRAQLIKAFDAWLEVPPESLEIITRVVGMLHTASLLVDDVEDFSLLRRGLPVAHNIFGIPQTINSANYIYFCALQELQRLRNPKVIAIFAEELVNLHRGQGMDLFWRDTLTCPTEDDYLEMVGNKTGGLFRLGIKLMQAESRSLLDCVPLVNLVGLIFQIADDYHNLRSAAYADNKGLAEDLTEGKFSFPVIHSIRADPANLQLLNILRQKTRDDGVKRYAVAYMERTGSFDYTRKVVGVLIERARKMTDEMDERRGKSSGIHHILDKMAIAEGAESAAAHKVSGP